ncbi:MAG TPA: class I SAM-dependent methyltransferase [Solirubrobacterales bacterium]|nr:class I SAM-dependent methyltransferase [Solirubrobacterales bacterium]
MAVIWHDVECGGYEADLPLWSGLAAVADGRVLDLGCGTGRVARHLARQGHEVVGLDRDPQLIDELNARATDLSCRGEVGDARDFSLARGDFGLALAPMQLFQLFTGSEERVSCLRSVAEHLQPGGIAAIAIAEGVLGGFNREDEAKPDSLEIDGRLYESLPMEMAVDRERIVIRRLRKVSSSAEELNRNDNQIELRQLSVELLEREAIAANLVTIDRRTIAPTFDHVGSTVVLLERHR